MAICGTSAFAIAGGTATGDTCGRTRASSVESARPSRRCPQPGEGAGVGERKVVIGLPVFNGAKYLAAAIESHLSQSFGDFELVISDNGSTDATPEICADFARRDDRLTYLRSPVNRGILWNHRR